MLLPANEISESMKAVPQWSLQDSSITRLFTFKEFLQAIDFVNRVAQVAEASDHHPDMFISYNKVKLDLSTHRDGGLTRKDFDLAAKVDRLI